MKKRELEMKLQRILPNPKPIAGLEQVPTPATIAADVLFRAYAQGDIADKRVADLGCGTGIFAIGSCLLGASKVFGTDIDRSVVDIGKKNEGDMGNTEKFDTSIEWTAMNVSQFDQKVDTVIMNPPFGAQKKHADRPFLDTTMRIASSAYTLCLRETTDFISNYVAGNGWTSEYVTTYKFPIGYTHPFHKKERKVYDVALLHFVKDHTD